MRGALERRCVSPHLPEILTRDASVSSSHENGPGEAVAGSCSRESFVRRHRHDHVAEPCQDSPLSSLSHALPESAVPGLGMQRMWNILESRGFLPRLLRFSSSLYLEASDDTFWIIILRFWTGYPLDHWLLDGGNRLCGVDDSDGVVCALVFAALPIGVGVVVNVKWCLYGR